MRTAPRRQNGATLIVTLVMLIMLTLFAISAMNTSTTNLQVVGNMQMRHEGLRASIEAIEATVSTTQFIADPFNAVPNPCGAQNTLCTDLNGDGVPDLTTRLEPRPQCIAARAIPNTELVINTPNSDDVACIEAQAQGTMGVEGRNLAPSLCANATWEITAQTLQSNAGTATSDVNVTSTQGVAVRMKAIEVDTVCPSV